ncbi:sugar transferase [Gramella lutea]|uniref:Sugar transferase n=1 Tax=Christiangramia lutea TaxID=1607951 RepID=A0A9X1V168_9FLAO|nr:sugar transferase [Christiangramia lutea]MCH4821975.1 sugar transferase [Christiangramia lutea]
MINSFVSNPEFISPRYPEFQFRDSSYTREVKTELQNNCKVVEDTSISELEKLDGTYDEIIFEERLNNVRYLNKFLSTINSKLEPGGSLIGKFEEYNSRKSRLLNNRIKPFTYLIHGGDILVNRVLPKLPLSKNVYYSVTKAKGRVLSKAEAFGRLYSCGFEITKEYEIGEETYFIAKKVKEPLVNVRPNFGPLIILKRVGKNGKPIKVYKLRTMHPYSEYLQDYVYQKNDLQNGGKFNNDFRISKEGKIFRKFWLDEFPMFINLIRGDIKLVGVRPLSKHYFNLYTKELQDKRTRTKPGLLPPFYADMPETLEEIIDSELKYLEEYSKAPLRTDVKYFWLAFKSIAFKGARSK